MNKKRSPLAILAVFSAVVCALLLGGCQSAPTAAEQWLYQITTNTTQAVTATTNTVPSTNIVESVVSVTNQVNGQPIIITQPVRESVVTLESVVTFQTNALVNYTYTASTNAVHTVGSIRAVANTFGPYGDLIGAILLGGLAVWGKMRSGLNRSVALNESLAQGVETLREILKTTPQGKQLDSRIVNFLASSQASAGVIREASNLVLETVDNSAAKDAARLILSKLPPLPPTPPTV